MGGASERSGRRITARDQALPGKVSDAFMRRSRSDGRQAGSNERGPVTKTVDGAVGGCIDAMAGDMPGSESAEPSTALVTHDAIPVIVEDAQAAVPRGGAPAVLVGAVAPPPKVMTIAPSTGAHRLDAPLDAAHPHALPHAAASRSGPAGQASSGRWRATTTTNRDRPRTAHRGCSRAASRGGSAPSERSPTGAMGMSSPAGTASSVGHRFRDGRERVGRRGRRS